MRCAILHVLVFLTLAPFTGALRSAQVTGPKRAYVTMLVNDKMDDSYTKSAAALVHTVKKFSKYPFLVAVTNGISEKTRCQLRAAGATVRDIDEIMDECPSPLPVCDDSKPQYDRRWVSQFTKLNLWKWTDYDQMAFYDADHLVVNNVDDVFEKCDQAFCSATDDSQGGFFVMKPNKDTANQLLQAYEDAKQTNWTYKGQRMWNEQPLLVNFFMDKLGKLPFKLGYDYHASNYKGFPAMPLMKAIHSKFWVEPLTPGRDKWYQAVKETNELVKKSGCEPFKDIDPVSRVDMAKDFLQQVASGTGLKDIHVKGFR